MTVNELSVNEIKHLQNCVKSANRDIVNAYENGKLDGYINAKTWHYVKDKLPPNPKESEDGKSILPLNYICAYECGDDGCGGIDYECDEFMYLGNGEWLGENKNYPIYAWMDCAIEVPLPRKEMNK